MLQDIHEIEEKALKLSPRERALLAEHLIRSLDGEDDPEAEKLWIKEAERRLKEYRAGKIKARSAEEVFKETYSKLK